MLGLRWLQVCTTARKRFVRAVHPMLRGTIVLGDISIYCESAHDEDCVEL